MEFKRPMLVASAFVENEGKYLLTKCGKFGEWRVPGGRIEPKERAKDTILREMKEEIGAEVRDIRFIGYGQDFKEIPDKDITLSRTVLYFKCRSSGPFSFDKSEVLDHKWLTLAQLRIHENLENAMKDLLSRLPENEL